MEQRRDFKSVAGLIVLSISIGMGMGATKTVIYSAIDDYNEFKKSILARIDSLERDKKHKEVQLAAVNNRLIKALNRKEQ